MVAFVAAEHDDLAVGQQRAPETIPTRGDHRFGRGPGFPLSSSASATCFACSKSMSPISTAGVRIRGSASECPPDLLRPRIDAQAGTSSFSRCWAAFTMTTEGRPDGGWA